MEIVAMLTIILQGELSFNKSRVECMAELILSLIKVRTVNMAEVAQAFSGNTKLSSKYRRIQRFFQQCCLPQELIMQIITSMYPPTAGAWILSLDRTNWNFGAFKINIMMLCINFKGVNIPIFFRLLPKQGSSSEQERISFMQEFLSLISTQHIASLLCDREFIGETWIDWLIKNNVPFTIRVKNNHTIVNHKEQKIKLKKLFCSSSRNSRILKHQIFIFNQWLYAAGMRLPDGTWLITVTNHELTRIS